MISAKTHCFLVSICRCCQSIKCIECQKTFKSAAFASFHAEKSGHTSFEESTEEIKPLTEQEKKEKLEELRAKLAAKRAAQSKIDAEENKANEKIRRKAGQDLTEIKADMERKEQIKEAERKRKEKADDAAFKAKIKAQIEADKRERAAKAAADKAAREGKPAPVAATPAGPSAAALAASAGPQASKSSANEARLRVRAPGGMWMGTLPADATLSEVSDKIRAEGKDGGNAQLKVSSRCPQDALLWRTIASDIPFAPVRSLFRSSRRRSQGSFSMLAMRTRRCASWVWYPTPRSKPRRCEGQKHSSLTLEARSTLGSAS